MDQKIVQTNIPGLDDILNGGIIPGHSYLIVGPAGSGKTILSLQWLLSSGSHTKDCMFISLAEPVKEIKRNVNGFNWNLDYINFVEFLPKIDAANFEEYNVFSTAEVESGEVWQNIYDKIKSEKPKTLVIDSITFLRYLSSDEFQFRKNIFSLLHLLREIECSSFLIFEPNEIEKDSSLALSVDSVIVLSNSLSNARDVEIRTIEVQKQRGNAYLSGRHPLKIGNKGLIIYPHIIENDESELTDFDKFASGIKHLDDLLFGGLETGTATVITGPSGVGKSTIGLSFLAANAQKNIKSVLLTFEETEAFITQRAENLGLNIKPYLQNGLLKIIYINPLQLFPDELLQIIRREVESGVKTVMLDSLRGYNISMEQFGNMQAHMHNMINYLKSNNISFLAINEVENITGNLRITDVGVSYIFDNALLLRFAEVDSRIMRVISCLKKRLGTFEPELRELRISNKTGIEIGNKLEGFSNILSGAPAKQ